MGIKVLGTGCVNCKNTIALIDQLAQAKGKALHAGGVPKHKKLEQWLTAA